LQQQLIPAQAFHLPDFLGIFFRSGYINFPVIDRKIKITEFASGYASVGDIYIPVDDPCDKPVVMMDLPEFITYRHDLCKGHLFKQIPALGDREEFQP